MLKIMFHYVNVIMSHFGLVFDKKSKVKKKTKNKSNTKINKGCGALRIYTSRAI